jgi:hypothetical protein
MRRKSSRSLLSVRALALAFALTAVSFLGLVLAQARTNPEETPEYCHRQYEKCINACDKDPLNKTQYDREACYSSCWSSYSGCGT